LLELKDKKSLGYLFEARFRPEPMYDFSFFFLKDSFSIS